MIIVKAVNSKGYVYDSVECDENLELANIEYERLSRLYENNIFIRVFMERI